MTVSLVNQTKSYTLAISKETGEVRFELSDELKENVKEMASEADTNADVFAGVLDLMGEDAGAYLAAMDELIGAGGTLADAFATGGTAAVMEMIAGMTTDAFDSSASLVERASAGDLFDNFEEIAGEKLDDMMDWGMPSFNPFADPGSEEGKAAIEAAASEEGLMTHPGVYFAVGVIGIAAAYYFKDEIGEKLKFIPADPNEPTFNFAEWLERPWNEESLDPTFGETMPADPDSDPNGGHHADGHTKDFDPDAELDSLILTNPEDVKDAVNAEQVQEAADFHYTSTTTPVEPEFQFKPDFGDPDLGGGENYNGPSNGDAMATATEYIILLATDEEPGLQLASDSMEFKASVPPGEVHTDGTSGAALEGALGVADAGAPIPDTFL